MTDARRKVLIPMLDRVLSRWRYGAKDIEALKRELKSEVDEWLGKPLFRFKHDDERIIVSYMDQQRYFVRAALGADALIWTRGPNISPVSDEIVPR